MNERDFAIDLARRAGAIIKENFQLGMQKQWKSDNSPVTATDIAINAMVIDEVKTHYPTHAVLGEEASSPLAGATQVWVCDPIDGTIPFAHAIPTCVFSLALVTNGNPTIAVVYDPFLDRLFVAEKEMGATLNGNPIHTSDATLFHNIVIGSSTTAKNVDIFSVWNQLTVEKTRIINVYSNIYMGALVASGELGAVIYDGIYAHDCATLKLLVEEAGGTVTDLYGDAQRYDQNVNGCIATNGPLHQHLISLIKQHRR